MVLAVLLRWMAWKGSKDPCLGLVWQTALQPESLSQAPLPYACVALSAEMDMLVVARKFKVGTFNLPDLVQSGLLLPLLKPKDQSGGPVVP